MNTKDQQKAIDLVNQGENVFITGAGGVGKSWVINQITTDNTVIAAPTGIAALNVGGSTCHSLFHLPIGLPRKKDEVNLSFTFRQRFGKSGGVERVIIDEISMVRADMLDLINKKLQKVRANKKPFGGIQMVVVGDYFQLPPIVSEREEEHYYEKYDTAYAFGAECWDFQTVQLNEVVRQSDKEQINILNHIRKGEAIPENLSKLKSIVKNTNDGLYLCCFNKDASRINRQEFLKIDSPYFTFHAKYSDKWGKEEPAPKTLHVKKGMRVIMSMNLPGVYVNGDKGVVEEVSQEEIIVRLDKGYSTKVNKATWESYTYKKRDGSLEKEVNAVYEQYPIKYGYAVSIHKSQGMTLDGVVLDVGTGCFTHGQLYVALSRCRDLSNISFTRPISEDDVIVDEEVNAFYQQLE